MVQKYAQNRNQLLFVLTVIFYMPDLNCWDLSLIRAMPASNFIIGMNGTPEPFFALYNIIFFTFADKFPKHNYFVF